MEKRLEKGQCASCLMKDIQVTLVQTSSNRFICLCDTCAKAFILGVASGMRYAGMSLMELLSTRNRTLTYTDNEIERIIRGVKSLTCMNAGAQNATTQLN